MRIVIWGGRGARTFKGGRKGAGLACDDAQVSVRLRYKREGNRTPGVGALAFPRSRDRGFGELNRKLFIKKSKKKTLFFLPPLSFTPVHLALTSHAPLRPLVTPFNPAAPLILPP